MLDVQSVGIHTSNPFWEIQSSNTFFSSASQSWHGSANLSNHPPTRLIAIHHRPFLAGGHDASQQGIQFLKSSRGMPRILRTTYWESGHWWRSGRAVKWTTKRGAVFVMKMKIFKSMLLIYKFDGFCWWEVNVKRSQATWKGSWNASPTQGVLPRFFFQDLSCSWCVINVINAFRTRRFRTGFHLNQLPLWKSYTK